MASSVLILLDGACVAGQIVVVVLAEPKENE
jgi:hypothetical protein